MDIRNKAMAGAVPFAHLLGLGRASAAARRAAQTEQDREDEREGEEDREEDREAASAETEGEEDRDEERERPDARGRRAAAEDEDAEEEEDEDEAEMRGNGTAAAARRRERKRCAAIFGHAAAAGQPHVAAQIAFQTTMSAKAAIKVLQATAASVAAAPAAAAPRRQSLDQRMGAHSVPSVGGGPAAKAPAAGQPGGAASRALASYRKALGRA